MVDCIAGNETNGFLDVAMTRIVTCSLKGLPRADRNGRRGELLSRIAGGIRDRCPPVDAVVLPGGYFVLEGKPGERSPYLKPGFDGRCDMLRYARFAKRTTEAAETLNERRRGALLIFGVDTRAPKDPSGDQLCVAWSAGGPVGIGRKVFPTKDEGDSGYIVSANDFGDGRRVVRVGGTRVLLCSCYDGYGIHNAPDRSGYIRKIWTGDTVLSRGEDGQEFRRCLEGCLDRWRGLAGKAGAAAVAIHRFGLTRANGFSTNYWRRHGIATAAAVLTPGWVAAGANFERRPPNPGKDILASHAVEGEFLSIEAARRPVRDAAPVLEWVEGDGEVRMRLFDFQL